MGAQTGVWAPGGREFCGIVGAPNRRLGTRWDRVLRDRGYPNRSLGTRWERVLRDIGWPNRSLGTRWDRVLGDSGWNCSRDGTSPFRGVIFIATGKPLTAASRRDAILWVRDLSMNGLVMCKQKPDMRSISAESAPYHSPGQRPGMGVPPPFLRIMWKRDQ